ncbi:MAG: hypothetical protein U0841_24060 [Chloroflexia bacterium]
MPLLLDRLSVYGEMLAIASEVLVEREVLPLDQFRALLFPRRENETLERELLADLGDLGIAAVDEHSLRRALAPDRATGAALRLHVLATLRAFEDENAVILDLYRFLLEDGSFGRRVLDRDAIWPRFNRHCAAIGIGGQSVILNSLKMASWLRLMTFVGLVRPERSNTFILAPKLDLLRAMLRSIVGLGGDNLSSRRRAHRGASPAHAALGLAPPRVCRRPGASNGGEIGLTTIGDAGGGAAARPRQLHRPRD